MLRNTNVLPRGTYYIWIMLLTATDRTGIKMLLREFPTVVEAEMFQEKETRKF